MAERDPWQLVLEFEVAGKPCPKGSKAFKGMRKSQKTGKTVPILVDQVDDHEDGRNWMDTLARGAKAAVCLSENFSMFPLDEPLGVEVEFRYAVRPAAHYGTGRNREWLKPSSPLLPITAPDIEKLQRSVGDALNGIVWRDDSRISDIVCSKRFAPKGEPLGATIRVFRYVGEPAADGGLGQQLGLFGDGPQ